MTITYYYVCSHFRHKIRCNVGSVDRSMRHNGTSRDTELFLSEIHVLVPVVDVHRRGLPLVLLAHVRLLHFTVGWRFLCIEINYLYRCVFFTCRTILQGKTSHKFIDMGENPIMHIYYTNRTVLGFMCLFNELFYAALYLVYFTPGPLSEYKEDFVGLLS